MPQIKSETPPEYTTDRLSDDAIIARALAILEKRHARGEALTMPARTFDWLRVRFGELEYEIFGAVFLDNRHRVIATEEIFRGTVDGASVYPREVAKLALAHNAAAIIFFHNHPSGVVEPSRADEKLTSRLRDALALLEIRVLDHIIVSHSSAMSFAERGLI